MEENKEEELIKKECLLSGKVRSTITDEKVQKIIIKKDGEKITYLSDVLYRLPHGLVSKEETGMGATSLELSTTRNSIIVEPIKITASSKAYNHSKAPNEKVLYVGSATKYHKKTTKAEIEAYIKNPKIQHKKIIVVADSLYRVINAISNTVYKDYFLLLDEVDSFQMDSTFRKSMEECIEYYKNFDEKKRCMLSATVIDFSDNNLSKEKKTEISYDSITKRTINVVISNTPQLISNTIDKIIELLKNYPNDKIMIAFNSVTGSYDMASFLKTNSILKEEEIKILCSKSSDGKAKEFYQELDSDTLPGKVNFVTSAYFSGFDLKEKYHLISLSGNKNTVHSLSDKRLKQIAGRCRIKDGLLSETVIHDLANFDESYVLPDKDSLIKTAQTQIDSLICIEKHYSKDPILKRLHSSICNQILKTLENQQSRFIKKDSLTGVYSISYLNVDAFLENAKTRFELYKEQNLLSDTLKSQQHNVSTTYSQSNTHVPKIDVDKIDRKAQLQEVLSELRKKPSDIDLQIMLTGDELGNFQKDVVEAYRNLSRYIDSDNLLDRIEEFGVTPDPRPLNNLISSANFLVYPPGNLFKRNMNYYFTKGKKLTNDQILDSLKRVFIDSNLPFNIDTAVKAKRYIKLHFVLSEKNRKDSTYKIKGENPYNLILIKHKKEVKDMSKVDPDLFFS